jgi:hypothetical protein
MVVGRQQHAGNTRFNIMLCILRNISRTMSQLTFIALVLL